MVNTTRFQRQLDLINVDKLAEMPIIIIGAGATGSFTALTLAKMGAHNITVYDRDIIDFHNAPNQFYRQKDMPIMIKDLESEDFGLAFKKGWVLYNEKDPSILRSFYDGVSPQELIDDECYLGKPKVIALKEIIKEFEGIEINAICDWFNETCDVEGIIITCSDNMIVRKTAFDLCKMNMNVKLFIDPRMGATTFEIYAIDPVNIDQVQIYEKEWFPQEEVKEAKCTAKTILYNVLGISSFIGRYVSEFINKNSVSKYYIAYGYDGYQLMVLPKNTVIESKIN